MAQEQELKVLKGAKEDMVVQEEVVEAQREIEEDQNLDGEWSIHQDLQRSSVQIIHIASRNMMQHKTK